MRKSFRVNRTASNCIGIDVCKGKWIAVCISDKGFEERKEWLRKFGIRMDL